MNSSLEVILTIIYWAGFFLTLWAGVTDRFRLKPYGLPRPMSTVLKRSVIDTFFTLAWFVYVPSWFIYRWARHKKRTYN